MCANILSGSCSWSEKNSREIVNLFFKQHNTLRMWNRLSVISLTSPPFHSREKSSCTLDRLRELKECVFFQIQACFPKQPVLWLVWTLVTKSLSPSGDLVNGLLLVNHWVTLSRSWGYFNHLNSMPLRLDTQWDSLGKRGISPAF